MKKRCAYCGEMIQASSIECEHCGKALRRPEANAAPRATGLQKWQKGVPSWMVYGAILFGVLFIFLMYYQVSQRLAEPAEKPVEKQPLDKDTD